MSGVFLDSGRAGTVAGSS